LNRITGGERPALFPIDHPRTEFTWAEYVEAVPQGDWQLVDFLQRMCGYSLTGSTREEALFFGYGTGANGKTKFIGAITGAMGDYHRTAAIETFTASATERHPTDLAGLHGARLVTAIETEEGKQWAEAKIKALTGGDKIAARFMRQDYFEFTPRFKLLVAGNNKPGLRSVGEAMRRRLHLIPFTVTIPAEERADLDELLRQEWPGILNWMVEGCLEWQRIGLSPPKIVTDATEKYFEAEDRILAWTEQCCDHDPNATETTAKLYGSWVSHCTRTGEVIGSQRRFSEALEEHGIERWRDKNDRGFRGLRLKIDAGDTGDAWSHFQRP
jgi:putative DNA primase/helicase